MIQCFMVRWIWFNKGRGESLKVDEGYLRISDGSQEHIQV